MLIFGQSSVGTSAVKLIDNVTSASTVVITNPQSTNQVYVGSSAVTTGNGCPVPPNGTLTLRQVTGGAVWAVANAGTNTVGYAVGNEVG